MSKLFVDQCKTMPFLLQYCLFAIFNCLYVSWLVCAKCHISRRLDSLVLKIGIVKGNHVWLRRIQMWGELKSNSLVTLACIILPLMVLVLKCFPCKQRWLVRLAFIVRYIVSDSSKATWRVVSCGNTTKLIITLQCMEKLWVVLQDMTCQFLFASFTWLL